MNARNDEFAKKLDLLTEALAKDVDHLSDEELEAEIFEEFGDPKELTRNIRASIESTFASRGKQRLASARSALDARRVRSSATIVDFPLADKKALYERLRQNDKNNLTLAARNEEDSEADLDSILEDLRDLGVIDDEGNIQ
tara:strand:- start:1378 stop:1800 length:423 start_codon:yes stop_codon:yes gene_type:complete